MKLEFGDYYGENIACKETKVSFGISGDSLDPSIVTDQLAIEPNVAFAKGDEYLTRKVGTRIRPTGIWSISSDVFVNSTSTELHAKYILNLLEPRIEHIERYVHNPLYRTSIAFWWVARDGHGGFTLSKKTLAGLCCLCEHFDYYFVG